MPRSQKGRAPKSTRKSHASKRNHNPRSHGPPPVGHMMGSWLGSLAGKAIDVGVIGAASKLFSKITGSGEYKIEGNTLLTDSAPPTFSHGGEGIRIRHREYIKDIISPGAAFTIQRFPINPGLPAVFPFLSEIATNFEEYRFHGLLFEFRTTSAVAVSSTNTALGTVVLATNYDSLDSSFSNKQQMESYEFSSSGPPCHSLIHPIECKRGLTSTDVKYVRTGAPPATGDLRFYDVGAFQLATIGQQAQSNIGELWVSYDIQLLKPRISVPVGAQVPYYRASYSPSTGSPFLAAPVAVDPNNTLACTTLAQNLTIPQPGRYWVSFRVRCVTSYTTAGAPAMGTGASIPIGTILPGSYATFYDEQGNGSGNYNLNFVVDIADNGGVITFNAATVAGANLTCDLRVVQIPQNVLLY